MLFGRDAVKRVAAGGLVLWLILHVDGEAVGELAAIVGQDGVNGLAKWARKRSRNPAEVSAFRLGSISR
jgi:hypothetical protein